MNRRYPMELGDLRVIDYVFRMASRANLRVLAWVALAFILLVLGAGFVFSVRAGTYFDPFVIVMLAFPVVGTFVASRQPHNAIGWIMLAVGIALAVSTLLAVHAEIGLEIRPGSLPRPDLALSLNEPMWIPFIGLPGTFLLLLFPDGRLPTPGWRPWAWFSGLALILPFVGILVGPGTFAESGYPNIENPLGIEALRPLGALIFVFVALIPISIVGCALALITRFRRALGRTRLQLKWLAAAAGVVGTTYFVLMAVSFWFEIVERERPQWIEALDVLILSFVLIPIAIGVAILRHRLYDIDVIVNRTLVYGCLTAALGAAYLAGVTALQTLLRPFAGRSGLAVAGSTLAVAALFRPVRAGIQSLIDRRFYRRKYDAARTLDSFSAKLRSESDLDAVTDELISLVRDVMQPAHVSLWLSAAPMEQGRR
jgi:hypothetical protein